MKRLFFTLLVGLLPLCAAPSATFTPEERAWLSTHPTLRFVYDPDWPPFEWRDEIGRHTGMIADVYKILSEETGIRFKPVDTENWAESLERFKAREADLVSAVTETEARKRFMRFTRHALFRVPGVLLQRFDAPPFPQKELAKALRGRTVGVVEGYAVIDYLRRTYPGIDLVSFPTITEGLERLRSGKIDLFATNDATAGYLIHKQGYGDLVKAATLKWYVTLKIGLQPDAPPMVVDILDRAIAAIPRSRLDAIYRRWTENAVPKSETAPKSDLLSALPLDTVMMVLGILTVVGLFGWYRFREKGVGVLGLPLLGATLLFFLLALLVTALALKEAKSDRKSEIAQSLQTVLNVTHSSLLEWFTTKRHQVNHLVNRTDFLKPYFDGQRSGGTPEDLSDRLFIALKSQLSGTTGYLLIDRNGTILSASEPSLAHHRTVTYAPVRRLLERAFREGYAFFAPIRFPKDRLGHLRHYYIFNAVVDPTTGEKVAIFAARLDPTPIFNIVRQGRIGRSGETYLMNAQLQMISRSRFERQLKELGLLPVNRTSFLNIRLEHDGKPTLAAAMALRHRNGYNVEGYPGYRGVEVLGAWVWDDLLNLAIIVEIDKSEAMASFRRLEQTIYGVVLGIVGLATMLVLFIVWYARTTHKSMSSLHREIDRNREALDTLSATIDQRVAERLNQAKGSK
jgi:ABC-type amino acid transport substrate-binding protein